MALAGSGSHNKSTDHVFSPIYFRNIYEYVGAVMVFIGSAFQPIFELCITDTNNEDLTKRG